MSENKLDTVLLPCYNRGCGKTFDPSKNNEDSCVYHPGVPVFHDAYKKWSCCEKKTTDFTEFLNIKGCSKSYHSNVKPVEPQKENKDDKLLDELNKKEVYTYMAPQPIKTDTTKRPNMDSPMAKLDVKVGASLKPLLDSISKVQHSGIKNDNETIEIGTNCKNGGCKSVYQGDKSNNETCIYHSGVPIFHEGLKYWTCCVKRTSDFDSFLDQVGCTTGSHIWLKPKNLENLAMCRYDWHQTGSIVVISVYSKCPLPESSYIEANAVKIVIHIVFGHEKNIFHIEVPLFGVIEVDNSSVTYLGSKVEINLKKSESLLWKDLMLPAALDPLKNESNCLKNLNVNDN